MRKIAIKWTATPKYTPAETNAQGKDTIPPPIIVEIYAKAVADTPSLPCSQFLGVLFFEPAMLASEQSVSELIFKLDI